MQISTAFLYANKEHTVTKVKKKQKNIYNISRANEIHRNALNKTYVGSLC